MGGDVSIISDLVHDGGMSAPAWAFFTAISLAILKLLADAVSARHAAEDAAAKAAEASALAKPTGNGFAQKVLDGQEEIIRRLVRLESAQDTDREIMMKHLLESDHTKGKE